MVEIFLQFRRGIEGGDSSIFSQIFENSSRFQSLDDES